MDRRRRRSGLRSSRSTRPRTPTCSGGSSRSSWCSPASAWSRATAGSGCKALHRGGARRVAAGGRRRARREIAAGHRPVLLLSRADTIPASWCAAPTASSPPSARSARTSRARSTTRRERDRLECPCHEGYFSAVERPRAAGPAAAAAAAGPARAARRRPRRGRPDDARRGRMKGLPNPAPAPAARRHRRRDGDGHPRADGADVAADRDARVLPRRPSRRRAAGAARRRPRCSPSASFLYRLVLRVDRMPESVGTTPGEQPPGPWRLDVAAPPILCVRRFQTRCRPGCCPSSISRSRMSRCCSRSARSPWMRARSPGSSTTRACWRSSTW